MKRWVIYLGGRRMTWQLCIQYPATLQQSWTGTATSRCHLRTGLPLTCRLSRLSTTGGWGRHARYWDFAALAAH